MNPIPTGHLICTNPACAWTGPAADCRLIPAGSRPGQTMDVTLCPRCPTATQSHRAQDMTLGLFFDRAGMGPTIAGIWVEENREHREGDTVVSERTIGLRFNNLESIPIGDDLPSGGFMLAEDDAVKLRDALTAAIDAPRLAARKTPEIVERSRGWDDGEPIGGYVLLRTGAGEWGVSEVEPHGDEAGPIGDGWRFVGVTWFGEAEREARSHYAEERGKLLCDNEADHAIAELREITDDQIRAAQDALTADPEFGLSTAVQADYATCRKALEYDLMHWTHDERSHRLRARCAEIIAERCAILATHDPKETP